MSFRAFLAAAALVLTTAGVTAPLQPAAAQAADPAKVRIAEQIVDHLKVTEVMIRAGSQTLAADPTVAALTKPEQDKLIQLYRDGMYAGKPKLLRKLAESFAADFTTEELDTLLRLSKIRYIQELVAQGGDPSLKADPSTMTAEESALVTQYSDGELVGRLAASLDFGVISQELEAITVKAFADFMAWRANQPA